MRQHWEQVWSFSTARFQIVAEVIACDEDPADQFDDRRDVEAIHSGEVLWFDARVRVLFEGNEIGADYLGGCAYHRAEDLFRGHATLIKRLRALRGRTDRRSRRERKSLRAALANNIKLDPPVIYCTYGPDMVKQACCEARKTIAKYRQIDLRGY